MDIIMQNILYYISTLSLEYTIATFVGTCVFLYACYYTIARYRYTQNRKHQKAKLKQLGGVPLSDSEVKILTKRNKYYGAKRPVGALARRVNSIKHTISTRWHKIIVSIATQYNPWALQDRIKQLQSERDSISSDRWACKRRITELQDTLNDYILGHEEEPEPEPEQPITEREKDQNISEVQRFGGGFGTSSDFA